MAGMKKNHRRKTSPPSIPGKITNMGSHDMSDLAEGVLFCLRHQGGVQWPAWEQKLLDDEGVLSPAIAYARHILGHRWPELEPLLISDPNSLKEYLKANLAPTNTNTLEEEILTNSDNSPFDRAHAAALYARLALGNRWGDGERIILDATAVGHDDIDYEDLAEVVESYRKRFFRKQAWSELNEKIRTGQCSPLFAVEYCCVSAKDCSPEVEEGLLHTLPSEDLAEAALIFACNIVGGRWEKGEAILGTAPYTLSTYAADAVGGMLPDNLHQVMVMRSCESPVDPLTKAYFEWLARKAKS